MSEHVSTEQLSLLVDGQLSLAAREAVVAHIRCCPGCAEQHDLLIELTAALRLHGALEWSPAQTAATVSRVGEAGRFRRRLMGRRDWSLPIASALALAGGLALALFGIGSLPALAPGGAVVFLPGASLLSGHLFVALAAAVAIGLLALPLSRSR